MPPKENSPLSQWRSNFFTGLAIVMPALISVMAVIWLFGNVSNITDKLLFFLPTTLTHHPDEQGVKGNGPMYWSWSCAAFAMAILAISFIGRYGRYYFGQKMIEWTDRALMHIPLLNKIYSTVKQVNESFSSNKSSFKQVVLVSFPHPQARSIGFVTGEQQGLGPETLISVFIPTTPNPTSGFLILVPQSQITKLDMTVADGIKFIISLGAISPDHAGPSIASMIEKTAPK